MANVYNSQLDAYSLYHKTQEEQSSSFGGGPALPALGHALAGSTGSAIANLAIYPLDLIITRLQVQRQLRKSSTTLSTGEYQGVVDGLQRIYNNEGGLSALYTGVAQDTGKTIADSFLFFLFYNYLRTNRLKKHGTSTTTLPMLDELTVGALAGACSKLFTTPISNIVTRKQTASMVSRSSTPPSVADIAASIREEKGLQGFWSGYSASLVLTLNPSITFFLYEFFKRTLLPRSQRDDPGARVTFLMAAISKAIASTITYPFSLAKARAQTSTPPPIDPRAAGDIKHEAQQARSIQDAEKLGLDAKNIAKRSTIFATILHIYRTEGPAALYEGVWGEILKGFFSHGITMLVKESVHKLIIQTYYLILRALNKYPSPLHVASQAGQAVQDVSEKASEMVQNGYANITERVNSVVESGREQINVAGERISVVGNNASETVNSVNNSASKEAGNLLGSAQQQLGDKVVGVGKKIKNEE